MKRGIERLGEFMNQLIECEVGNIRTPNYERYNQKGMHPHDSERNFNTIILFDRESGFKRVYSDPHILLGVKQCTWKIEPKMKKWVKEKSNVRSIIGW